jgi:FAD binding domain-containing protein/berberine-like enzyme
MSERIEELRAALDGPVIAPGSEEFEDRRRVWNADIDRRPAAIARCASTADVAAAIGHAREHGLEISVRGGAHNTAGTAVCDGGLMIDLSLLNSVAVDPAARRARVGGGALLADLDAATQAHGLAVPAGLISHTGVGGLTLGGGMGWLSREFGLSIDNLVSAVHEVDPTVQVGMFFWGLDQGPEALRLASDVTSDMPPGINAVIAAVNAPPAPFVPEQYHFAPGYVLLLTGFGGTPEHARLVTEIRQTVPPLFDVVAPMPYTGLQQLLDEANAWGHYGYEKGTYIEDLTDEVIDAFAEHVPEKNSPMSVALLYRLDGAYSQVGDDDTAFSGGRSPRYGTFIIGQAPDADLLTADRDWVRDFWRALRPYAVGSGDGYVNGTTDYAADRVRSSYGPAKYERLAAIKSEYDPDNVFHLNANIAPA